MQVTDEEPDSRLEESVQDIPEWFQRDVEMRAALGRAVSDAMNEQNLSPGDVADRLNERTHTPGRYSSLDVEKFMSANSLPSTRDIARYESALDIDLISVLMEE